MNKYHLTANTERGIHCMFLWAKDESQAYLIMTKQCKIMYPMEHVDSIRVERCDDDKI